ncbi:metallophosphoesterase family protein [Mediterraneibacter sp. ICN-202921]|uniref:metallophosphoesterase family protein n=1 Tax=Mediterraneibacter sp. ICN-202921 TaxID=3134657 RepID=UPI0030C25536
MRFIHIADIHLGATPDAGKAYSAIRPKELWDTFEYVIEVCEREKIDLLLIAGDLFHRQPLLRELKEVNFLFSSLSHTKVVLIAGNHDYIGRDSYYRTFQWSENVYPLFGEEMEYVAFPEFQTAVYGFSYYSREILEAKYDTAVACGVQPFEILLAHGGDEKHIPIHREKLEKSGFAYVALGHIHQTAEKQERGSGFLKRQRILYAGSLEPIDRNDIGIHGFVEGEIRQEGVCCRRVPCAKRQYIHMQIPVDERQTAGSLYRLMKQVVEETGVENIYKITLRGSRDADIVFDTANMDAYGNILEILDETHPVYDFARLAEENSHNLLGVYIRMLQGCPENSVEYKALCEGVEAILTNMHGEKEKQI